MMVRFVIHNAAGSILRVGSCAESDLAIQVGAGESLVKLPADYAAFNDDDYVIVNSKLVLKVRSDQELMGLLLTGVRRNRDSLLASTDWTQLPDAPQADRQAWAKYRQALRDLPASIPPTARDLTDITWPTRPGEQHGSN